ncbi:hypothetical protein [Planctobacterium marinum]|uniref:Uncharacterized protein n=1 Tax=Planctobacterium marinum TaxID=1631968 RepID=A0AA48HRR6_9ALTE|nr:hypothetical protein MACH26_30330 [Planctobacterium marinum]
MKPFTYVPFVFSFILLVFNVSAVEDQTSWDEKKIISRELDKAFKELLSGNAEKAANILKQTLESSHRISSTEKIEVLGRITEFSYIAKSYDDAVKYGTELFYFLNQFEDKKELQRDLIKRICSSKDWQATKEKYTVLCAENMELID